MEDYLTFRGTVNVRAMLSEFDILVLSSYNEGQPIVALEAMTAGVPIVSTEVGGMAQLIDDPLTTPGGRTWGRCGYLGPPASAGRHGESGRRAAVVDERPTDLQRDGAQRARSRSSASSNSKTPWVPTTVCTGSWAVCRPRPTEFGGAPSPSVEAIPRVHVSSAALPAYRVGALMTCGDHSHENIRNVAHDC